MQVAHKALNRTVTELSSGSRVCRGVVVAPMLVQEAMRILAADVHPP